MTGIRRKQGSSTSRSSTSRSSTSRSSFRSKKWILRLIGFCCLVLFLFEVYASYNMDSQYLYLLSEPPYKSTVRACDVKLQNSLFKSQSAEDKTLLEWFGGLCGGTYVEMGALDGVEKSNSYVFNKGLDWKGVLVELGPTNFARLKKNRPNELAVVHAAVCGKRRQVHYVENKAIPAVGGIWEFMAQDFKDRWFNTTTIDETSPMECLPLKDVLMEAVGENFYFDFFSLDIEGAEYDALASLDFSKVAFGIILVEANAYNHQRKNVAIRLLLEQNGYTFLKDHERSYWFVNNAFTEIYKDHLH